MITGSPFIGGAATAGRLRLRRVIGHWMEIRETSMSQTAESVTEGHPDKVADYIADSILDAYPSRDPYRATTNYGYFGRSGLPWEMTPAV